MFEVGKKYKRLGVVRTCVFVNEHGAVLQRESDSGFYSHSNTEWWKEYVEPKVVTTELLIRTNGTNIWTIDPDQLYDPNATTIGRIRITHTEGQGLKVEVLD
jgi:hypothetical protein